MEKEELRGKEVSTVGRLSDRPGRPLKKKLPPLRKRWSRMEGEEVPGNHVETIVEENSEDNEEED